MTSSTVAFSYSGQVRGPSVAPDIPDYGFMTTGAGLISTQPRTRPSNLNNH